MHILVCDEMELWSTSFHWESVLWMSKIILCSDLFQSSQVKKHCWTICKSNLANSVCMGLRAGDAIDRLAVEEGPAVESVPGAEQCACAPTTRCSHRLVGPQCTSTVYRHRTLSVLQYTHTQYTIHCRTLTPGEVLKLQLSEARIFWILWECARKYQWC